MSKVIFFSIPAHGHTNPTLPLVKELIANGEEVIYYSTDEFREKVIATGASYREIKVVDEIDIEKAGKNLAFLYYILTKVTQAIINDLIEEIRIVKPDYIIHDAICSWGRYAAEICNIPAVSSVTTFAFSNKVITFSKLIRFLRQAGFTGIMQMIMARHIQLKMQREYGVKAGYFIDTMMNEEKLNIVFTSELLQPDSVNFDKSKYKFTGPSMAEREKDSDTTDYSKMKRPIIYISMGTVWKNNFIIEDIIDALIDLNYTLVISGTCADKKYYSYDNVIIKEHINQIEVLKHCDLFITHGGVNSVNESLFYGVPLCVHPFQMEQEENAERIVELNCGIRINKLNKTEIRSAVLQIIGNNMYKENCRKISDSFHDAGGYKKAAEYILEYKNSRIKV